MPIKTSCSQCQANFELPERLAGKTVRCQKCQATFKVPDLPIEPAAPALAETQPLNPIAAVDPPPPANDPVVATMVGPPPVEKEEEIVTGKLVERADTAPPSKPTPPRSRRPMPEPTSNTGTGAIIAVIAIGLFACLLLAGGGGAAVFFLGLRQVQVHEEFNGQKKVKPRRDFDDKKGWDFDDRGKGWKEERPKPTEPPFDFRTRTPDDKPELPWKTIAPVKTEAPKTTLAFPKTTEAPKTDIPNKTAKLGRIEDLPADERMFWDGVFFNEQVNLPGRLISPIPVFPKLPDGRLVVDSVAISGTAAFQIELVKGKEIGIAMTCKHPRVRISIHDGDRERMVADGGDFEGSPSHKYAFPFEPRRTGKHVIFVTSFRDRENVPFKMEIVNPTGVPVKVDPNSFPKYQANHYLSLADTIFLKPYDPRIGHGYPMREYAVSMKTTSTYNFFVTPKGFGPSTFILGPDESSTKGGPNRINFIPPKDGVYRFFVIGSESAFGEYHIEITETDIPDKTKISRIEDLPANERVFWQGVEFGPRRDVPVRFVSPIPKLLLRPNGILFANADTSQGISAFQADFEMGKRVNIGIQTGDVADVQVHDGDGVVAKDWCDPGPSRLALSFVPRKTGPHAIYIANRNPKTCYFSLEVAFPNKKPVEVSFVNSTTYKDKHSVTVEDNIIPRVKGFQIALSREYIVELQAGKRYSIKAQTLDGRPESVRIERPDLTLLTTNAGGTISPSEDGKYHFFITNGTKAFFSYELEITLRSKD